MNQPQFGTLRLGPGAVDSFNAEGTNFWIIFSPVPVQVLYPNGEFGIFAQGTGLDDIPGGGTFKRLTIRNPSLGSIIVMVYVGGPLYRDSRLSVMEAPTRFTGRATQTLAATGGAGDHVDLDGINPLNPVPAGLIDLKRQSVLITNNDLAAFIEVIDVDGNVGARVLPSKQIILSVSEFIRISNPNALAISCQIAEIWNCARA